MIDLRGGYPFDTGHAKAKGGERANDRPMAILSHAVRHPSSTPAEERTPSESCLVTSREEEQRCMSGT